MTRFIADFRLGPMPGRQRLLEHNFFTQGEQTARVIPPHPVSGTIAGRHFATMVASTESARCRSTISKSVYLEIFHLKAFVWTEPGCFGFLVASELAFKSLLEVAFPGDGFKTKQTEITRILLSILDNNVALIYCGIGPYR
jgi:hypothetical protein